MPPPTTKLAKRSPVEYPPAAIAQGGNRIPARAADADLYSSRRQEILRETNDASIALRKAAVRLQRDIVLWCAEIPNFVDHTEKLACCQRVLEAVTEKMDDEKRVLEERRCAVVNACEEWHLIIGMRDDGLFENTVRVLKGDVVVAEIGKWVSEQGAQFSRDLHSSYTGLFEARDGARGKRLEGL